MMDMKYFIFTFHRCNEVTILIISVTIYCYNFKIIEIHFIVILYLKKPLVKTKSGDNDKVIQVI